MRAVCCSVMIGALGLQAQEWQQLPDFPGSARDDAASFTLAGRIYVGTGMDAGFQLTNDWWCFDMATASWSSIAPLPSSPRQYSTGFTIADTGYVFGGVDAGGALDQLWAYHPENDSWEQKASMPAEARYASVAVTGYYWNAIVATGMLASGVPTKEAWRYDAPSDSWELITPVPGPSRHRAACFLGAGGLVIAGGADSTFTALSDAWSYPIWFETGLWYVQAPLPAARFAAGGSWGTAPTVIGGATGPGPTDVHADAWRWNGSGWQTLPLFAGGSRRGGISASGPDGPWSSTIYYGLGSDNAQRYRDWWRLEFPVGIGSMAPMAFSLSPVPADELLTLSTSAIDGWTSWEVWSMDQRLLLQGRPNAGSAVIGTGSLPAGAFVLRLSGIHGTAAQRFTVAH